MVLVEKLCCFCLKAIGYGDIQLLEGRTVKFIVPRDSLTKTVSQILANLEVVDLTVTEPAIEEVIGRVFQTGDIEQVTGKMITEHN